jgi:hypothetical protein
MALRATIWPYVGYVLFILKEAYRKFEEQVGT